MIYPIILAGQNDCSDTTLAGMMPEHFQCGSMMDSPFQSVVSALNHPLFAAPTVVTCEAFRYVAAQQMAAAGATGSLVIEPCETKSAAALAALAIRFQDDPEAILLVLPADHEGVDQDALPRDVEAALPRVYQGNLVMMAVRGDGGLRGYGRINSLSRARAGAPVQALFDPLAAADIAEPEALWNSGIYLVRAGSLLAAFKRYAPRLLQSIKPAVEGIRQSGDFLRLAPAAYGRANAVRFEMAVLAKMETVVALPTERSARYRDNPPAPWVIALAMRQSAAARGAPNRVAA